MTGWTSDELAKTGAAEELKIASARRDGTLRNPGNRETWTPSLRSCRRSSHPPGTG
jgi:hypothetical protein